MSWDRALLGRLAGAKLSWLTVWIAALTGCASGPERTLRYPDGGALEVHIAERALIIALRPGDETLSAAGLAQRVIKRVTDHEVRGWWLESDATGDGVVRSDSWLFGPVSDEQLLGVVRWPRVRS